MKKEKKSEKVLKPPHSVENGWIKVTYGSGEFDFYFVCRECGNALPSGFPTPPCFCCYCGKEHG